MGVLDRYLGKFAHAPITVGVAILCGIVVLAAMIIPLSLFYTKVEEVGRVFWWIFWVTTLLSVLIFGCCGLDSLDTRRGWCFVCMGSPVLVGWWLLADFSKVLGLRIARDVDPDSLERLYDERAVAMYIFKEGTAGGYVQSERMNHFLNVPVPTRLTFSYACHGFYESKICSYEEGEDQECGSWVYPSQCPGYHSVVVAPYWSDIEFITVPPGDLPKAMVFQLRTFLFNEGEDELGAAMDAHWDKQSKTFSVEHCYSNTYCALDIRDSLIQEQWPDKRETLREEVSKDIGEFQQSAPDPKTILDVVDRAVLDVWRQIGLKYVATPLLWMPHGTKEHFGDVNERLDLYYSRGKIAAILLSVVGGVWALGGVSLIVYGCFLQEHCFKRVDATSESESDEDLE